MRVECIMIFGSRWFTLWAVLPVDVGGGRGGWMATSLRQCAVIRPVSSRDKSDDNRGKLTPPAEKSRLSRRVK